MAPSTPPPPSSERLAALTMACTSSVVMSATTTFNWVLPISALSSVMRMSISPALRVHLGVEIDAALDADIGVMRIEEPPRRALAELAQQLKRIVVVAQLAGRGEPLAQALQHHAVHVDAAVFVLSGAARDAAGVDLPVDEFDGAQLGHQRRIEGDLVDPRHDLARRGRQFLAHQRIDLHD